MDFQIKIDPKQKDAFLKMLTALKEMGIVLEMEESKGHNSIFNTETTKNQREDVFELTKQYRDLVD